MQTTVLGSMVLMVVFTLGCAVDGGPGVIVDRAWWRTPNVLRVSLWTTSDDDETFELADVRGDRHFGMADCLNGRCLITFEDVAEPVFIWLRSDRYERATPLLECGADPFGLCPFGYGCVDRVCEPLCSASHLDGVCIEDGAVCEDGWCSINDC